MYNHISQQAQALISLTKKDTKKTKTKVISITSGKGGVGKSTITANMAFVLSNMGFKVAIFDADIGLANMQILLNVKITKTFFDFISGGSNLQDILIQTKYKNITLCAGKSGYEYSKNTNSYIFSRIISQIVELNKYDFVLVDTSSGLNSYVQEFLNISDEIIALTSTDPSAITDVYALIKMLSETKKKLLICFNYTKNYKIGEIITNSIINLAKKNGLNEKIMVKYIGSISDTQNVKRFGQKRELFADKLTDGIESKNLRSVVNILLKELKGIKNGN
jgi:flagellar biosynthesis protein FlhG